MILTALSLFSGWTVRKASSLYRYAKSFQIFEDVFQRIQKDYVDETSEEQLLRDAINGMIGKLDPHSRYVSADYFKKFNQNYEGYSGIGISFDVIRKRVTVMSVIPDGPADKAGLIVGDRIIAINGESAIGIDRDEAPKRLMGTRGTSVRVTVEREGITSPEDFTIIRDDVHVESIPYAFMMRSGVAYMDVIRFSSTTGKEISEHLKSLNNQGMMALIIDLRNNGGGYLNSAVEVVDRFLPGRRKIIYTNGRSSDSFREFYSTDKDTYKDLPVIILINRFSASASEIVAGSLQDWDRALIVGETSFGKGLVQSQYRFRDGSALLMTTARYYTPIGRLIQRPYDNVSLEEYYVQIVVDSLRTKWENNTSRPQYRTKLLRRQVLGGGGITPDLFFQSKQDTITPIVRRIVRSPQRMLFTFVEEYLKTHTDKNWTFQYFLRDFQPNGTMLKQFLGYIRELGLSITDEEFLTNKRDIQYFLKQSVAEQLWGEEARFKVQMLRDRELLESVGYIDEARNLLNRSYRKE